MPNTITQEADIFILSEGIQMQNDGVKAIELVQVQNDGSENARQRFILILLSSDCKSLNFYEVIMTLKSATDQHNKVEVTK